MRQRSCSFWLLAGLLGVALLFAACGTHGKAPPLGQVATISLKGAGSARLSPTYATHVSAYFKGKAIPVVGAQTPAQLHEQNCSGPLVANLTDGIAAPNTPLPEASPDPAGGMDVAVQDSTNLYVSVYDHANDPEAQLVGCGHPLSGLKQFFDLYPPNVGSNGVGRGTALMEPIVATDVTVSLAQPVTGNAPETWAIHTGSCSGTEIGTGVIAMGATQGTGVIFRAQDAGAWRLTLTPAGAATTCTAL